MLKNNLRAFTLVEVLIIVGIAIILASASIPIYGRMQVKAQLDESTAQIVQALRSAKTRARAGLNDSAHGVFFDYNLGGKDSYTLYQGESFDLRDADYDVEVLLDDILSIENQSFVASAGDIDINFVKFTGKPNNTGEFLVRHELEGDKVVEVKESGLVISN